MSSQTPTGILQPDFTFDKLGGLLEEHEHRVQEPFSVETAERDKLFWLMNDFREDDETTWLNSFALNPHATGSTTNTFGNSDQSKRNAGHAFRHYSEFDFETSLAQPSAGWGNILAINPAQDATTPYEDLIGYSDFLNRDSIEGESNHTTAFAEDIHAPSGSSTPGYAPYFHYQHCVEVRQFTHLQAAAKLSFNDDDYIGIPFTGPDGAVSISNDHYELSAAAEGPVRGEGRHKGATVSGINFNSVTVTGLKSLPGNEPATTHYQDAVGVQRPLLMGSHFNFDFDFDFLLKPEGEAGVHSANIFAEPDAIVARHQGTNDNAKSDGVAGELNENLAQDAGRNDYRDDKENKETEPLEPSSEANISTPANEQLVKHKDYIKSVPKPTSKEVPGATETSKLLGPSNVGTSEKKSSIKRKATNPSKAPVTHRRGEILNTSKEKQRRSKKVRITKDQAIAGKRSGILTCNICVASSVINSVYTFNRQADLNCHIQVVHEKTKQLTCPNTACVDKTFSKLSSLKRHKVKFGH